MFGLVLSKWKHMYKQAAKDRDMYKSSYQRVRDDLDALKTKVRKMEISFNRIHPRWGEYEYVEMAMDLFNKYCAKCNQAGKLADGRKVYYYQPDKNTRSMKVVPTRDLPDGYMRYVQKYEEPHEECVYCSKKFITIEGYPAKNAKFCDENCFNRHVWAQEDQARKEKKRLEGEDTTRED